MSESQSQSITLYQLAAHGTPNTARPDFDDVGLQGLVDETSEWWALRRQADIASTFAMMNAGTDVANRAREILGLFGSIAEQAMIAAAVEIEVEHLRRARSCGDLPEAMIIAERWYSEHEGQTLLGIGHALTNLVMRAALLRPDLRAATLALGRYDGRFLDAPGSDDSRAWISFGSGHADALLGIGVQFKERDFERMCRALKQLAESDAWTYVEAQRGEDFHRWRRESSVLSGVDSRPLEPPVAGRVYTLGETPPTYTDANEMEQFVAAIVHDAATLLGPTLNEIRLAFEAAAHSLTDKAFGFS